MLLDCLLSSSQRLSASSKGENSPPAPYNRVSKAASPEQEQEQMMIHSLLRPSGNAHKLITFILIIYYIFRKYLRFLVAVAVSVSVAFSWHGLPLSQHQHQHLHHTDSEQNINITVYRSQNRKDDIK